MVLGGKLIVNKLSIFYVSLIFLLNGCAHASLEEGVISGKKISLDSETCLLTIDNKTLIIEMKPKCYFVKKSYPVASEKEFGVYYYDDIDAHVLHIIGTSASKNHPSHLSFTLERDDCGEQRQVLNIKKETTLLYKAADVGLICAGLGADEKVYNILSHP
jgi:hypothetical protein